jgi:predicted acyl esterase
MRRALPQRGLFVILSVLFCGAAAHAAGPLGLIGTDITSPDGVAYTLYAGQVATFDGVPLDVHLTVPQDPVRPRPLIVMLHGWGGDRSTWESATIASPSPNQNGYNNVAFVARGYAVLTYTSRGFHGSCGVGAAPTPASARGWTQLADRRYEIRDTKFLASLLVDAGVAIPDRIGVTGASYGGGQAWLLALEADRVTVADPADPEQVTLEPWTSPLGTPLHLAAAVPEYGWSDLVNSLVPNGRAADGTSVRDGNRLNPIGIEKQSYVGGLYFLGSLGGTYAPTGADPTADLTGWVEAFDQGEPYDTNPVATAAIQQLAIWKSPYYQRALITRDVAEHTEVPVLNIHGWTDALFPAVESVSLVRLLKATDRSWPVSLILADVGHPNAQNKGTDWTFLNAHASRFLDQHLLDGRGRVPPTFTVRVTTCDGSVGRVYTGTTWRGLAPRRRTFRATGRMQETRATPPELPGGAGADALFVGGRCIRVATGGSSATAPHAVWDFPVTGEILMLGTPRLTVRAMVSGADVELNARLWDRAPDGSRVLVTRGMYRLVGGSGTLKFVIPLGGNAWRFPHGHTIELEMLQNDAGYLRADNLPSSILYRTVRLQVPSR